ncbi:unnamed protein product [Diamesa serratosioi]
MNSINLDITARLERNDKNTYINGVTVLVKLLENLINFPAEEKYRKIKKSNVRIKSELLIVDGMIECLLDFGFETDNDELILKCVNVELFKRYRDYLMKRLDNIKTNGSSCTGTVQKKIVVSPVRKLLHRVHASKNFRQRIFFPKVLKTSNMFLSELEYFSDSVMQYEDKLLVKSALEIIPVEKLKLNAMEKLRKIQKLIQRNVITDPEPPFEDLILEELATWFKNDFFTWINNMPCSLCKNDKTQPCGSNVSQEGVRIEKFKCTCNNVSEFHRYNDIEKLLVTRIGRCGEFANCFTFLCRCLGYDARYVYSTSDHVWTEVYSHSKNRWIHLDPSENVFDSPLMYEHGWRRELNYVIAFSLDDVQDVSWRYSNQHQDILKRRQLCNEKELIHSIMELRKKRQVNCSAARKKFLNLRTIRELAELLIIRECTDNERKGRSSGSLNWRLERGETDISNFYVFNLLPSEDQLKQFNIRYSCTRDTYERFIDSNVIASSKGWRSLEFLSESIFRKEEHDHKMVYIARTEGSTEGKICWKFDFGHLKVQKIVMKLSQQTYEDGKIIVDYLNDKNEILGSQTNLNGLNKFSIRIRLSGGKGDCSWQHAQLFRQSTKANDYPFELKIKLN